MSQHTAHQINHDQDPTQRQAIAPNIAHQDDVINSLGHVGIRHAEHSRFSPRKLLAGISLAAVGLFGSAEQGNIDAQAQAASKVPAKSAMPFASREARPTAKAETASTVPSVWSLIQPAIDAARQERPNDTYYKLPQSTINQSVYTATETAGEGNPVKKVGIRKLSPRKYKVRLTQELNRPVIDVAAFRSPDANSSNDTEFVGIAVNPGLLVNETISLTPMKQSAHDQYKFIKLGKTVRYAPWYNLSGGNITKTASNGQYDKDPLHNGSVVIKTYKQVPESLMRSGKFFINVVRKRNVLDESTDPHKKAAKDIEDVSYRLKAKTATYADSRVPPKGSVLYRTRIRKTK